MTAIGLLLYVEETIDHFILYIPYLGLHNAHWCIMCTPSWSWKSPEKN